MNVDVSAELDGYWADTGASAAVGPVVAEPPALLDATRRAQRDAIVAARAGRPLRHIGRAVERCARRARLHGDRQPLWPRRRPPHPRTAERAERRGPPRPHGAVGGPGAGHRTVPVDRRHTRRRRDDGWTLRTTDGSLAAQFEHTLVVTHGRPLVLPPPGRSATTNAQGAQPPHRRHRPSPGRSARRGRPAPPRSSPSRSSPILACCTSTETRWAAHTRHPQAPVGMVDDEWAGDLVRSWETWIDLPAQVGDALATHLLGAAARRGGRRRCHHRRPVQGGGGRDRTRGRVPVGRDRRRQLPDRSLRARGSRGTQAWNTGRSTATPSWVLTLTRSPPHWTADGWCLSHVAYGSGASRTCPGSRRWLRPGALVLWDLSRSAGAVPVPLGSAGVDLAVGYTYKHLNAGPGAPAFPFCAPRPATLCAPADLGLVRAAHQFTMAPGYEPVDGHRSLAHRFPGRARAGTRPEAGGALMAEAGIGAPSRRPRLYVTDRRSVDAWLAPFGFALPPRARPTGADRTWRWPPRAWRISQALMDAGVVPDFRTPVRIRLGPAPIATRFVDVWDALDRLRRLVERGAHRHVPQARRVT